MKRLFILATAATVALASCTKTQVVYNDAPQEIAFKQITNVMTKADPSLDDWKNSDMGVYAVKTDDYTSLYLNNAQFAKHSTNEYWSGSDGSTEKKYYWPFQGSLDFYVYAPFSDNLTFDSTNKKLKVTSFTNKDYTDENTYSGSTKYNYNCVDLMYGETVVTGQKRDDALNVSLKHALAKVIVKVSASVADVVKITSVVLNDTYSTANLTVAYTDSDSNTETPMSGSVTWDNYANQVLDLTIHENTSGTAVNTSSTLIGEVLVIPGQDQTSFTIKYTLENTTTEFTAYLNLSTGDNWTAGTQYTYDIYFDAKEIKLNPTVSEWGTGSTPSVTTGGVQIPVPTTPEP